MDGSNYVRVRVCLDVRKALTHFISIKPEGAALVITQVKYKKVPRYCAVSGLLGDVKEECDNRVHPPGSEVFGKWMLADTASNHT